MEKMLMRIVKYVAFAANLCVFSAAAVGLGFGVFALVDGDAVAKLFAHVAEGFEVWTVNIRSRKRPAQEETAYLHLQNHWNFSCTYSGSRPS